MATRRLKDLPKDLDTQISVDFNELLRKVHFGLSNNLKKRTDTMPVWTGFFASSWKVQASAVIPKDKVENFRPWSAIKRERSLDFFARRKAGPPFKKQTRPKNPEVSQRFPIGEGNRIFNYKRPVYIGNRAIYSLYVIESGKIQSYVQGTMAKLIRETMTDKGKIYFGTQTGTGFGSQRKVVGIKLTEGRDIKEL